mgnify:CR=1 FL=1
MLSSGIAPQFQHREYLIRRKIFTLWGAKFHIYDEAGNLVFFSRQKPFRLREDFRIYSDETQSQELLVIKTPQILDIWATYQVIDSISQQPVGALRRKALKSIIRDEWLILAPDGREIGKLLETTKSALLSRLLDFRPFFYIPQKYLISDANGQEVARIEQNYNPFVLKYRLSIIQASPTIDPRLIIACGILLAGIERRQRGE